MSEDEAPQDAPPSQPPPSPPQPLRPLGAHSDLTHPGGTLKPFSPVRDAPPGPADPPKGGGSVGVGILLAVAWAFVVFALGSLLLDLSYRHPWLSRLGPLLFLAVVPGLLVAIHAYAIRSRKSRILIGFWGAIAVAVLAFVVTCFALVWQLSNP